ncbi:MAG TPA: orotidine-5'-phosphate decarboxylase [Candidatus Limnocylindrales bacterium]|nr:orotidine-5'-phosphate decarboxylase [Candidatus Limnocylindrales bacterium]
MTGNPIIVALDVETADEARTLARKLSRHVNFFKVGMELFAVAGPDFVRELVGQGKDVFLDLKYYDIPETVKRATAKVAQLGVKFLTVHAVSQTVRAADAGATGTGLTILAVTVLTSMGAEDLAEQNWNRDPAALVEQRTRLAVEAGAGGIVASPLEAANVRRIAGPKVTIVTPGVRSAGIDAGDQKRVATPAEAIRNGADYLVIGRQITRAKDPAGEAQRILSELSSLPR